MQDNGHQIENPDLRKMIPPTPEQRAVPALVERIINPERPEGNWGIGRFAKLKQRLLILEIEQDDVRHLYVAALGREQYERLKGAAEADSQIGKTDFSTQTRSRQAPKAVQTDWIGKLREGQLEDWITVSATIPGDGEMQSDSTWYYRLRTDVPRKRLPRRLSGSQRSGQRYVGELVPPYLTEIAADTEYLWEAARYTLENPPR